MIKNFYAKQYELIRSNDCFLLVSWQLRLERGGDFVLIRSLKWLGMMFFHVPNTSKFGSLYVGTGVKNNDVPFML